MANWVLILKDEFIDGKGQKEGPTIDVHTASINEYISDPEIVPCDPGESEDYYQTIEQFREVELSEVGLATLALLDIQNFPDDILKLVEDAFKFGQTVERQRHSNIKPEPFLRYRHLIGGKYE